MNSIQMGSAAVAARFSPAEEGVLVVPYPDEAKEPGREADEPRVPEVIGRPCLPRQEVGHARRFFGRSLFYHALHQIDKRVSGLRRDNALLRRVPVHLLTLRGQDTPYGGGGDIGTLSRNDGIGRRKLQRGDLRRAEGKGEVRGERAVYMEFLRKLDHPRHTDPFEEPHRCGVERKLQGLPHRHRPRSIHFRNSSAAIPGRPNPCRRGARPGAPSPAQAPG